MKKGYKLFIIPSVIIIFTLAVTVLVPYGTTKEPGSESDPIVTLSYLELKLEQLKDYIDKQIPLLNNGQPSNAIESTTFKVIELKKGQNLIAGSGTEIILRSGEAVAITSSLGGLSDVTGAKDIQQGEKVPANHLIITPRDDGRGMYALVDSFLMVRGEYTIK